MTHSKFKIQNLEFALLPHWLAYLEQLHPKTIAMGLERVAEVKQRLQLAPQFPIITVAGTNGKGSTCAMLESILNAAGYRVGCYTSPHLLRYNERVRVGGVAADDAALCASFRAVEAGRGDILLTYFEFGTLAAMWHFMRQAVDAVILEVGLGGRLDAVNVFDPDVAIVTSVDIDHTDYLGNTRELIGHEKAGIFRTGKPAICADPAPPHSVPEQARRIGADFHLIGQDFGFEPQRDQWQFRDRSGQRNALPYPALRGAFQLNNAAACIAALNQLKSRVPVAMKDIRAGLLQVSLPGRFQVLAGRPPIILDVAHNPQAARALAENLAQFQVPGKTIAVFGMLRDKDIAGVADTIKHQVDLWLLADIQQPRGATAQQVLEVLRQQGVDAPAETFDSVGDACRRACHVAGEDDKIIIFGSFYVVADALGYLEDAAG